MGEKQEAVQCVGCGRGMGGTERSHKHTGKRGTYIAATGENPTHESAGKIGRIYILKMSMPITNVDFSSL